MNNFEYPLKKHSNKTKLIIAISIISVVSIVIFVLIFNYAFNFLFPALLLGGFFDNPPDQDQLFQLVNDNLDNFDEAIEYIHTLDPDVFGIECENGILHFNNSSYTHPEISNEAVQKIFDLGVESIYIKNKNAEFSCGGAGSGYYIGIIYSNDGEPITDQLDDYMNESHISFTKAGDGWEGEWSGNRYYCEKIIDNWYCYQTWW